MPSQGAEYHRQVDIDIETFKKLSTLQKTNYILKHLLEIIVENSPAFDSQTLKTTLDIEAILDAISKNDIQTLRHANSQELLSILKQLFLLKPNNALGWAPLHLSENSIKAISSLQRSKIHDKEVNVDDIIKKLIKNDAFEEARLIHHVFYLGYLIISSNKDNIHNKTMLSSVANMIAPWLIKLFTKNDKEEKRFLTDKSLNGIVCSNILYNIQNAIHHQNKLNQPFDKTYLEPKKIYVDNKNDHSNSLATKEEPLYFIEKIWRTLQGICSFSRKKNKNNANLSLPNTK